MHWIPGDPFSTHVLNVLHLLLPAGEEWFVETFKEALPPLIEDEKLREDVVGFIGQEAMHSNAHSGVLVHLKENGLDPTPYTQQMEWTFSKLLGPRPMTGLRAENHLVERLAIIAAIEHITAFLGDWVLNAKGLDKAGMHPTMLDLLRWHGAEEVEHRSVAYDVMRYFDKRETRRIRTQIVVTPVLVWLWIRGTRFLMRNDPELAAQAPSRRRPPTCPISSRPVSAAQFPRRSSWSSGCRPTSASPITSNEARPPRRCSTWRRHPQLRRLHGDFTLEGQGRHLRARRLPRFPAPPDLSGKNRPDRAMRITELLADKYLRVLTAYDYNPPEIAGHNPDTAMNMVVSTREVVATDENVFACASNPRTAHRFRRGIRVRTWTSIYLRVCGVSIRCAATLPTARGYSVAVRRIPPDGGGGSIEMHALQPGEHVTVRGPRNGFPFVGEGSALFVAGGIGITPIIAMVRAARELGGMDWYFVYSGRSRESMPFLDEIATWDPERVFVRPDDEFGLPTTTDLLGRAPVGGAVYCCGPTPMLDAVRRGFRDTPSTALHFERFGGAPPVIDGKEFEVQLVNSGQVLAVPADESALDVIKKALPGVGYSCQQGFCGTCRVKVLAGKPDHRERRLTDTEQETEMLICVSRSDGGRLVLDL